MSSVKAAGFPPARERQNIKIFNNNCCFDVETALLDDLAALGVATGTAVFKHLFARYYAQTLKFTYWHGKKNHEVVLVAEADGQIIPFEVKYRAQHTGLRELKVLIKLCETKQIQRAYVVTKSLDDFGKLDNLPASGSPGHQIMRIPAPLLCYWMGASENSQSGL